MPLLWPPFADVPVSKTLDDRLEDEAESVGETLRRRQAMVVLRIVTRRERHGSRLVRSEPRGEALRAERTRQRAENLGAHGSTFQQPLKR